jgi:hypothetical protein
MRFEQLRWRSCSYMGSVTRRERQEETKPSGFWLALCLISLPRNHKFASNILPLITWKIVFFWDLQYVCYCGQHCATFSSKIVTKCHEHEIHGPHEEMINAIKSLVWKPEWKRPFARHSHRWKNIKWVLTRHECGVWHGLNGFNMLSIGIILLMQKLTIGGKLIEELSDCWLPKRTCCVELFSSSSPSICRITLDLR